MIGVGVHVYVRGQNFFHALVIDLCFVQLCLCFHIRSTSCCGHDIT